MSKAIAKKIESGARLTKWDDLMMLVKFRLTAMVVVSSILAYFVVAGAQASLTTMALLTIGGFAITFASNGINQVLEKEFDALMTRTQYRPLAANRMKSSEAVLISGFFLVVGVLSLSLIHPMVAFLGMCSFILYAFIYTPMKRYSTLSVAIGAIPGALPVLIGTVAHEGSLTIFGLVLFLIQFLWQFPHFWAISFLSFDDYSKAGYKLLPTDASGNIDKNLGFYSAMYSLLIFPVLAIGHYMGIEIHMVAMSLIIILTTIYTALGFYLQIRKTRKSALILMFSSFFYLPLVLILYLIG